MGTGVGDLAYAIGTPSFGMVANIPSLGAAAVLVAASTAATVRMSAGNFMVDAMVI